MINISNEEITNKMFFIRDENSNQPIAVIKVGDLMKFLRPKGKWICDDILHCKYHCSECRNDGINIQPFCAWCGADMRGDKK